MTVNSELVEKMAALACLSFSEKEAIEIAHDFQSMISLIEKLNEVDTEGVEPLQHMTTGSDVLRDDTINGVSSRDNALKNAPENDGVFFKVPKAIRK